VVTVTQLREVVQRLVAARQWKDGGPNILIVADAGYDVTRLAFLLQDLPVELLGRLRSDRVMCRPTPPRFHDPRGGRRPRMVATAPKPAKPCPGRPPGSTNRRRAPVHNVGKTVRRETALAARFGRAA
jgi:hypothetical protein